MLHLVGVQSQSQVRRQVLRRDDSRCTYRARRGQLVLPLVLLAACLSPLRAELAEEAAAGGGVQAAAAEELPEGTAPEVVATELQPESERPATTPEIIDSQPEVASTPGAEDAEPQAERRPVQAAVEAESLAESSEEAPAQAGAAEAEEDGQAAAASSIDKDDADEAAEGTTGAADSSEHQAESTEAATASEETIASAAVAAAAVEEAADATAEDVATESDTTAASTVMEDDATAAAESSEPEFAAVPAELHEPPVLEEEAAAASEEEAPAETSGSSRPTAGLETEATATENVEASAGEATEASAEGTASASESEASTEEVSSEAAAAEASADAARSPPPEAEAAELGSAWLGGEEVEAAEGAEEASAAAAAADAKTTPGAEDKEAQAQDVAASLQGFINDFGGSVDMLAAAAARNPKLRSAAVDLVKALQHLKAERTAGREGLNEVADNTLRQLQTMLGMDEAAASGGAAKAAQPGAGLGAGLSVSMSPQVAKAIDESKEQRDTEADAAPEMPNIAKVQEAFRAKHRAQGELVAVRQLTSSTYAEAISGAAGQRLRPTKVVFFHQGHSPLVREQMEQLYQAQKELPGVAELFSVDCSSWHILCKQQNMANAGRHSPVGVFLIYPAVLAASTAVPEIFMAPLAAPAFREALAQLALKTNTRLKELSAETAPGFIQDGLQPWKLIVFSSVAVDRFIDTPVLAMLAADPELGRHVDFAFASWSEESLMEHFGIQQVPAIVLQRGGRQSTRQYYGAAESSGSWRLHELKDWVWQVILGTWPQDGDLHPFPPLQVSGERAKVAQADTIEVLVGGMNQDGEEVEHRVRMSKTATFRDVKVVLARHLKSPGILKMKLVKRSQSGKQVLFTYKDQDPIADVRKMFLMPSSSSSSTVTGGAKASSTGRKAGSNQAYQKLGYGDNGCPAGLEIRSATECEIALESLGMAVGPKWVSVYDGLPRFCSVRESPTKDSRERMHFNSANSGTGRNDLAPVCKAPRVPMRNAGKADSSVHSRLPELTIESKDKLLKQDGFAFIYLKEGLISDLEKTVFEKLAKHFESQLNKQSTKMNWMWVNTRIERKLKALFDPEALPSAVIYNPHKRPRIAKLKHPTDDEDEPQPATEESIVLFLNTVLGGDAKFTTLPSSRLDRAFADRGSRAAQPQPAAAAAAAAASSPTGAGASAKTADKAAAKPVDVSWMKPGVEIVVTQKIVYKMDGKLYELPPGMRGVVQQVDPEGDAEVEWDATSTTKASKWLLKASFNRVKKVEKKPEVVEV
eukprot:TRINITY_DN23467_c0_g1_i1.p1 TRINITY_DN23467_c0_g1~~TRINITY_DN23467_c0_g1_i1.p1  ORF type:complete len:1268 (-),score=383.29 TRINITY_DN23467_c0_g1_i1:188-3991(-)